MNYDMVWIIGGSQIYKELLTAFNINSVYVTHIHKIYDCDTGFPSLENWTITSNENNIMDDVKVAYQIYKKDSTDL